MKLKRTMTLVCVSLSLAACSSVPKPAEPDGNARVPVNDPTRVQDLQKRAEADRRLLTDNNLLRAQVDVLQVKLSEMTAILREVLTLPPPKAQQQVQIQPQGLVYPGAAAQAKPQAMTAPAASVLPAYAYTASESGVVIRVFHPFARTEFEPSEQVAQALRASVQAAEVIEVRGHTDSNVVNPIDKMIAIERAEKARTWLINNGANGAKIRTKYFTAGTFLTENKTAQGRSMNRRVEIDIRNQQLSGQVAANR